MDLSWSQALTRLVEEIEMGLAVSDDGTESHLGKNSQMTRGLVSRDSVWFLDLVR